MIAVISTLIGLSLPAISKVESQAKRMQCVHRLRSWNVATQSYASDHSGLLPPDGAPNGRSRTSGWYIDLPREIAALPYHEAPWRTNSAASLGVSVWHCPANPRRSNGHNLFHFCLNRHINGSGVGVQVPLESLRRPSELIWLFDNGGQAAVAQWNNVATGIHVNGANYSFLDGHVATESWGPHPSTNWLP